MLGNIIKELRLAYGMNQVEFAKKLLVTKQTISNWENNNIQPSIDMLIKIADFFNVSTDYLLSRNNEKTLNVSELSNEQLAHINMIIKDITNNREVR